MMLTIHGLPPNTKYNDIKSLIKEKCNISDFILGTLGVEEDRTKKIRVGVASDSEGDVIMKYLDGYRFSGHVIRIVPIGKSANEISQMNTLNDTSYQWRNNQQPAGMNYGNQSVNPGHQPAWPMGQSSTQWTNNHQIIPQQMQSQNNFGYIQPAPGAPHSIYQQERFPQGRGPQESFSNVSSNAIEPVRGNPPRPHVLSNVVMSDQQPSRHPAQGRYSNQGYNNPEKSQTISKDHFQEPLYTGPQSTQPEHGRYQDHQWPAQGRPENSRFPKQNPSQFEKSSNNKIIQPDKREVMSHNKGRNFDANQYEKGGRRFSPPRDQKEPLHGRRMSPPGHRISPNGHRILPSGRRISPAPQNFQFKNRISPPGRNILQPDRRISPSGRRITPSGRRISPSGRRFSPQRQISPSERQFAPSEHRISQSGHKSLQPELKNLQSGFKNSASGRRFSPGRQISPPGRQFAQPGRRISPSDHRFSSPGRQISPSGHQIGQTARQNLQSGRRISPPGHRNSPKGRQITPSGRPISPSSRRSSPPSRRISPPGRQITPSGRRISPSYRLSPSGRRMSPSGRRHSPDRPFLPPGRQVSPGRRISPTDRRISPGGRRMSPVRRTSPSERRVSPGHRIAPMNKDPQGDRHMAPRLSPNKPALNRKMSPARNISPNRGPPPRTYDRYSPSRKTMDNLRAGPAKDVRPAYASMAQAQNPPMYSGGYLPDSREIEQYPTSGPRKGDQRSAWQEREKPYQPLATPVDDRRDVPGMQKYDSRRVLDYPRAILNQSETKVLSPNRTSRSPNRRDRSPVRERYRRHSPSPRSPRRSWALEKRRSSDNIEPPPPPSWPERQENEYLKPNRQNDERNSKKPDWEKTEVDQKPEMNPTFFRKEDHHRSYDREDRTYFISPTRTRWDSHQHPKPSDELRDRSPIRSRPADRYTPNQNESKLSREDFDMKRRNEFQPQGPRNPEPRIDRYQLRDKKKEDFDELLNKCDDYRERFEDREEDLYLGQENLDREIEDVYKRAAELTKKTEEYQRKRNEKPRFSKDRNDRRTEDHDFINRGGGSSRQDFYEASQSRFDRNPRHVDEMRNVDLAPAVQYKRDKAVDEITGKILLKFAPDLTGKVRDEVEELLKISIEDMIFEMFGDKDVSFIEIVIKFEDRYGVKDMEKIFDNVISKFPIEIRLKKRSAPDVSSSPAQISRSSSSANMRDKDLPMESNLSDWNISSTVEEDQAPIMAPVLPIVPMMFPMVMAPVDESPKIQEDGYHLYLCKDNFEAFNEKQGHYLKEFIVKNIIDASETSNDGWTPDVTLRGVLNETRYVVWTRDELSKNWLLQLDFSKFGYFNVIIYTSENFQHERAAIWLPGHSKTRTIPPLKKLIMQNRHLENVNIHTWKLVKEIMIEKGTRLYVDMPPSSARALQNHNMTLSYELQKVQVFLKAVAIDKNAFDAGLEEASAIGISNLYQKNAPMPAIDSEAPNVVKICLDNTPVSVSTARKIKDELILQIYKYIKEGGKSRTDFLKYGYCKPGYFCVIPENSETAKWVKSTHLRKINSHTITIYEAEKVSVRYITMTCLLPYDQNLTPKKVIDKFKTSNRGERGLKFNLWKNGHVFSTKSNTKMCYRADVDLESVDTLIKLKFVLDYSVENRKNETVDMRCHYTVTKLKNMIQQFKEETTDTLNVINMDISSGEEDVICLD